jgi:hypothetical protein
MCEFSEQFNVSRWRSLIFYFYGIAGLEGGGFVSLRARFCVCQKNFMMCWRDSTRACAASRSGQAFEVSTGMPGYLLDAQ